MPRGFEQPFATATEERRRFSPDEDEMTSEEYKKAFGLSESYAKDPKKLWSSPLIFASLRSNSIGNAAIYFWAFIAIALAGFGSVLAAKGIPCDEKREALLTASCLGLVFSVAWYFVNRASKLWQENWEKHVDLLEDEVIGPLIQNRNERRRHTLLAAVGTISIFRFQAQPDTEHVCRAALSSTCSVAILGNAFVLVG